MQQVSEHHGLGAPPSAATTFDGRWTQAPSRNKMRKAGSWRGIVALWLAVEFFICQYIMAAEPTYAFDWDAYMEQVSDRLKQA
jgi:hypothetical protein